MIFKLQAFLEKLPRKIKKTRTSIVAENTYIYIRQKF